MKGKLIKFLGLFTAVIVAGAILTGCKLDESDVPEGFVQTQPPIIFSISKENIPYAVSVYLYHQFKDINPYDKFLDGEKINDGTFRQYFLYDGEKYYAEAKGGSDWTFNNKYTVYRDDGRAETGCFIEVETGGLNIGWRCENVFLNGQYLYYCYAKGYTKKSNVFSVAGTKYITYYKYEFYRFDMETGENEIIGLNLLFEKLQATNGFESYFAGFGYSIEINKNYKGTM